MDNGYALLIWSSYFLFNILLIFYYIYYIYFAVYIYYSTICYIFASIYFKFFNLFYKSLYIFSFISQNPFVCSFIDLNIFSFLIIYIINLRIWEYWLQWFTIYRLYDYDIYGFITDDCFITESTIFFRDCNNVFIYRAIFYYKLLTYRA